jgi:SAM-dependent methyltransferase
VCSSDLLFDLIVLSHVFEHFIAPELVIERLRGLLKPGGRLFFELPNAAGRPYRESAYTIVPDFYFFDTGNFSSFAAAHGFEIARAENIDYRRIIDRYDNLGHVLNYAWWAALDLFDRSCFVTGGPDSIWFRALAIRR